MRTIYKTRGFTLIEIIVSIVAIGILMALLVSVFAPEVVRGTDPLFSIRATELGQSYLEEILSKRFDENSPQGNTVRCGESNLPAAVVACSVTLGRDSGETSHTQFDDADDYNGLNESPPIDSSGNARAGYESFRLQVAVTYAGTEVGLPNNTRAKKIIVTVTDPRSGRYVFSAYKANF